MLHTVPVHTKTEMNSFKVREIMFVCAQLCVFQGVSRCPGGHTERLSSPQWTINAVLFSSLHLVCEDANHTVLVFLLLKHAVELCLQVALISKPVMSSSTGEKESRHLGSS